MYTLTFANGQRAEVIDGVISFRDGTAGEQRDAFSFQVHAKDISYDDLLKLVNDPDNTGMVILTNDEARGVDPAGKETVSASEAYYGYIDLVSIKYIRMPTQEALLDVPADFEWIYEVSLAEQTNSQKQITALDAILSGLSDADAAKNPAAFPLWSTMGKYDGVKYTGVYESSYRVRYNELLYKCIQTHETVAGINDTNPADRKDLWLCISVPSEEWPEWQQPESINPYELGAKVTYKGRRWISIIPNNVWRPGEYGWEEVI